MSAARSVFSSFVAEHRRSRTLLVQPRMGFSDPAMMRRGLHAVAGAGVPAVGTVTLDSYTRTGQHDLAAMSLESGVQLNGYPLVALGTGVTAELLDGLFGPRFPVQVRHGSPQPEDIFAAMLEAGLDASEGGPVSYCLPYSSVPLRTATASWSRSATLLAAQADRGVLCHLESFGGCMLGQLCPPGLLVALSVLECLFFAEHGVRSVSASYAQQTSPDQDAEALWAMRRLCAEELAGVDFHIVLYTYMGLFPETPAGARELLAESVRLAVRTGTERLIVKTTAEAHRIPTVEENVDALRLAHATALDQPAPGRAAVRGHRGLPAGPPARRRGALAGPDDRRGAGRRSNAACSTSRTACTPTTATKPAACSTTKAACSGGTPGGCRCPPRSAAAAAATGSARPGCSPTCPTTGGGSIPSCRARAPNPPAPEPPLPTSWE